MPCGQIKINYLKIMKINNFNKTHNKNSFLRVKIKQ